MNKQNQWLFEAPLAPEATHDTNLYTNPEYYNPEWELPEGSNDGSLVGEEENNYWPSHPSTVRTVLNCQRQNTGFSLRV